MAFAGTTRRFCRSKNTRKYLSNGLIWARKVRERSVAEPKGPGGVSKALNAPWIRPFLFLIFIVVAWDLTIRLFRIPPYQIPAPGDVVVVLWQDWPELMRQGGPPTYATICGFLLSAGCCHPAPCVFPGSREGERLAVAALVVSR